MPEKPMTVVKDAANPEPDVVIAEHIRQIADAMDRFNKGPLKREVLVLLIQNWSKVGKRDIENVLTCIAQLKAIYLKPTPAK